MSSQIGLKKSINDIMQDFEATKKVVSRLEVLKKDKKERLRIRGDFMK